MLKRAFLIILLSSSVMLAKAQSEEQVYNRYLDFNLARLESRRDSAFIIGEEVLPNAAKLADKARTNFYFSMGSLYENDSQSAKALPLYEKVAAAAPNYYVVHRALGYIYNKQADDIADKLNAARANAAEYKRLKTIYTATVKKALPHLEKAQACDPSPETLTLIKMLYKNINDEQANATLSTRLKALSANCIDLLDDK
ncbi:hypothetical protein FPZ43_10275 [Mucilaginibacter pallidiroseus]|uniref:Uncharacterized protein n=1 Tax=Mucilaginibacter pallidiroseus TaxID=2599295 RepID=A0A563UDC7_9SPHI|nr:hypothetical protein [Mucilaginibacter pallidiroseus]TWR29334.1 hypothetical protein FPZ43_10275 [Mucilaginibacter pallidiroseus]